MHTTQRVNRVCALMIALCAFAPVLAGCGPKNNLVGKWKPKAQAGQGANPLATLNMTKEFKADGTETTSMNVGPTAITMDGTYTVSGDSLTETIKAGGLPGAPASQLPGVGMGGTQTSKFKVDGDTLTMTGSTGAMNVSIEFERVTQ